MRFGGIRDYRARVTGRWYRQLHAFVNFYNLSLYASQWHGTFLCYYWDIEGTI